jgi:hypothetical protein
MTPDAISSAEEFVFSTAFAVSCRWIKRNPSDFLRFAFFPFGGFNVERWPRALLFIVRWCAIAGFVLSVVGAINGLIPPTPTNETPTLL